MDAGNMWHKHMKGKLAKQGVQPVRKDVREKYRLGGGKVVRASTARVEAAAMATVARTALLRPGIFLGVFLGLCVCFCVRVAKKIAAFAGAKES